MKTIVRLINVTLGPILALVLTSWLARTADADVQVSQVVGGAAAGCIVIGVELVLTGGPAHFALLRRWLDPRAAFEGLWLQEVYSGQRGNTLGVFSFAYEAASDSFSVEGSAYSEDGTRWATWDSTHMFFSENDSKATYIWRGELIGPAEQTTHTKSGLTELQLRGARSWVLPVRGMGRVSHIGESAQVRFRLRRVDAAFLRRLGLPFSVRTLRLDANDEERALVGAFLSDRGRSNSV